MIETDLNLTDLIKQEANRLGFLDCSFSEVRYLTEHEDIYNNWLTKGYQADMEYMERNIDKRINPSLLVEGAKTIISLLYNYFSTDSLTGSELKISKYAYGKDYHYVVKEKLGQLDLFIRNVAGEINQRYFVDSAPILERAWAYNSGLGWIGKNSCLISKQHGSFFFISEIITSLELKISKQPVRDYCASCSKCAEACPTGAINENRTINSNLCISYQTIENRKNIPVELKNKFKNYIFGCDICQDVCPWNKKAKPNTQPMFMLKPTLKEMTLSDWNNLDEKKYQDIFQKSAVKRTKISGLKRNIEFLTDSCV